MVSVASVVVNLILNVVLVRIMGYKGLALGTAIAAMFNAVTLLILLRARLGGLDGRRLAGTLIKICIAAAVMGLVASQAAALLERWLPGDREWTRVVRVGSAIGAALVALAIMAQALRIEEFTEAARRVLRRLKPATK
jgi:putative peptidoglycan lipid II flippase